MSTYSRASNNSESVYHLESADPRSELVDRASVSEADVSQIDRMMVAMGKLRQREDQLSEASTRYMKLNKTDMRALRFLIVCQNNGNLATPGEIAAHLKITTASTTKLLDRLEHGGHIVREPHPTDRRALVVRVTPQTRSSAMNTVGKHQAKRFKVASERTPKERDVIISFLEDTAQALSLDGVDWVEH